VNKLVPFCAWLLSNALEIQRLRLGMNEYALLGDVFLTMWNGSGCVKIVSLHVVHVFKCDMAVMMEKNVGRDLEGVVTH